MIYNTRFGYTQQTPEPLPEQVIVGSILGDGYYNSYTALTIENSVKQAPYVLLQSHILYNLGVLTEKSRPTVVSRFDNRTDKYTYSLRFD